MHKYKIDNYLQDNPGGEFPAWSSLSNESVQDYRKRLYSRLRNLRSAKPLDGVDASGDVFSLREICSRCAIRPQDEILFSFDSIQTVFSMNWEQFSRTFEYIWYPISDNIAIFDRSESWILFVHHSGCVYMQNDMK